MHVTSAHPRGLASRGSSQLTHHARPAKGEIIDTFKMEKPKTQRSQLELDKIDQYNYLIKNHEDRKGIQDL